MPRRRGILRSCQVESIYRLLRTHHWHLEKCRYLATHLGRKSGAAGYTCINVGKMHTWPLDTPAGYHQRYVVENKDRFLEGRFSLMTGPLSCCQSLVKQQRLQYRELSDYRERMGAFEWLLPSDAHSDNFVADRACWWIDTAPRRNLYFCKLDSQGRILLTTPRLNT